MSLVETTMLAIHVLTAATFVGTVVFFAGGVLPLARSGALNADPLGSVTRSLRRYTRVSALLLLLTGMHLATVRYDVGSLTGTGRGHLVLGMVGLWVVTVGLTEVGAAKLADGVDEMKVREPAENANRFLKAAAVAGSLALIDAALILTV